MDSPSSRLIVALDFPDLRPALEVAKLIGREVGMLKVGLELFHGVGPRAIQELNDLGARVFYDAKLHDIPNTVAAAAAAIGRMGVAMVNVHALGGIAVMAAAKEAVLRGASEAGFPSPLVVGVTILTSLSDAELSRELGFRESSAEVVPRLARLAQEAGLDGVVASVHEVPAIKQACGRDFLAVTPGVRPAWSSAGDQARIATPRQAVAAGADYLVIGRPITRAPNPGEALAKILSEMP